MSAEIWVTCSVCYCRMNIALSTTKIAGAEATRAERFAALKEAGWGLLPNVACGLCMAPMHWKERMEVRKLWELGKPTPASAARYVHYLEFMKRWENDHRPRQRPARLKR